MFKIGQKVVCIKANPTKDLVEGEIYTITEIKMSVEGVKVAEAKSSKIDGNGYFYYWRFREIDDTWVERLLCKLMSEVEADELVSA